MRKNNAGYTLVELIVSIAAAALVFAAASSFMLLGLRMEKGAADNAAAQNESNIIMRALETIAAEGRVGEIVLEPTEGVKWYLCEEGKAEEGENYPPAILGFNEAGGFIFGKGGVTILDGVKEAEISYENNVLTCGITTEKGDKYESSVYCRVGVGRIELATIKVDTEENKALGELTTLEESEQMTEDEADARKAFLLVLLDQYGSTGKISDSSIYDGLYYSQWYKLEWGRDTPWCSIFLSWGLNKTILAAGLTSTQNLGSLVDDVMWYQFGRRETGNNIFALEDDGSGILSTSYSEAKLASYESFGTWKDQSYEPVPGDLVFFERGDDNNRADHIGVVLYIDDEDNVLYTIEGNNNNRVGIFAYPYNSKEEMYMTEEMYVIGYGVIDWKGLGFVKDQ